MNNSIRALVVDDSSVFRMAVSRALRSLPGVEVIGTSRNGREALDIIAVQNPTLVTMDFEMPEMDGMQALKAIVRRNLSLSARQRSHVVMLSAHTKAGADLTIEALDAGAFDFIGKPDGGSAEDNFGTLCHELSTIVSALREKFPEMGLSPPPPPLVASSPVPPRPPVAPVHTAQPAQASRPQVAPPPSAGAFRRSALKPKVILIGVSTGGPMALSSMLPELSRQVDLPILVVQHMPPKFTQSLAESLARKCRHKVVEATHGDLVRNDTIYIAPGGHHMEIAKATAGYQTVLHDNPPENGCRPAVDVLFRSAATVLDGQAIAIVLTGMGSDGTQGLRHLREKGVPAIVQDKETCVVWGMPGSAWNAGLADQMLPLGEIPGAVLRLV